MSQQQLSQKQGSSSSPGTPAAERNSQGHEIGTWQNPDAPWGAKSGQLGQKTEIIVDSKDKEAWPSIGANSEPSSDAGDSSADSASAKSGSVISSSNNHVVAQRQTEPASQESSAIQGLGASSVWGANFGTNPMDEKKDSSLGWGSAPGTATSMSSGVWGSPSLGNSVENDQASVMQSNPNNLGGNLPSSTITSVATSTSSFGWGGLGDTSRSGLFGSSGAQNDINQGPPGPASPGDSFNSSMTWQGIGLSDLDKPTSSSSGWDSSSVMGLSIAKSINNADYTAGRTTPSNWGPSPIGSGWVDTPKEQPLGWGSPNPTPQPDSGTEGWSSTPKNFANPGSGWGMPGQTEPAKQNSNWNRPPSRSGWNEPEARRSPAGWDSGSQQQKQSPTEWGQADSKPSSAWGQSDRNTQPQQWGGAAPSQTQWGNPPPENTQNQWGGGNPGNTSPAGAQQQQQFTFAQAAGKGLNPSPSPRPDSSTSPHIAGAIGTVRQTKEEMLMQEAINSTEGWGKQPVRQDTQWDLVDEAPKRRNSGSDDGSHWSQPNNGTAIWESSKDKMENVGGQGGPGVAGAGTGPNNFGGNRGNGASGPNNSSHWGNSDNDSGTWTGPPSSGGSQRDNEWVGSSSWGSRGSGGAVSSGSSGNGGGTGVESNVWDNSQAWAASSNNGNRDRNSGSWGNGGKDSQWNNSEDMEWDRNGTSAWAHNTNMGGPPERPERGQMERDKIGTWREDGNNQSQWASNRPPNDRGPGWDNQQQPGLRKPEMETPPWSGAPNAPKAHWNNNAPPPKGPNSQMWGPPTGPSGAPPNWGEPPQSAKPDAPGVWGQPPQQGRVAGWGDGQWGGPNPKGPGPRVPTAAAGWGEPPGDWNRKMQGGPPGPYKQHPPQMRSRMLQQLMDMGFKKEDAQKALISNNMDLDSAIADLVQGTRKLDLDDDHRQPRRLRGMGSEDASDTQPSNQFNVPPMQNTPVSSFPNAQSLNSQVIANNAMKQGASLQMPTSSLVGNSSISIQQKLLQQQHNIMAQQQVQNVGPGGQPVPGQNLPPQGQPIRGQLQVQQHQLVQQQIVQQLRLAVQARLINPELLNQQLTPQMLITLQQLLQLQNVLQQLLINKQTPQMNPIAHRQQNEALDSTIQKIRQQIMQKQQLIAQAQQALAKQAPPTGPADNKDNHSPLKNLTDRLSEVTLANNSGREQSRLAEWLARLPSPDKEQGVAATTELNKAPGSKPSLQQSHSTPNLQAKDGTSSSLPLTGDGTWSATSTASDWPTSTDSGCGIADNKDRESVGSGSDSGNQPSNSSTGDASTGTALDISGIEIPEFVPGQKWIGFQNRSVEDDPNITPGSMKNPFSLAAIRDEEISTKLGRSSSNSPTMGDETNVTGWSLSKSNRPSWSTGGDAQDVWGAGNMPKTSRPPPGLNQQKQSYHRSRSWAPGDRSGAAMGWGNRGNTVSFWLLLKNLTPQIDGATLKTLCLQHGPLQTFYLNLKNGWALVRYGMKEEAIKAQGALNGCVLGNTTILADFVSDAEVQALHETNASIAQSVGPSSMSTLWSQSGQHGGSGGSSFRAIGGHKPDIHNQWNGAPPAVSMWGPAGGRGGVWGPSMEDHSPLLSRNLGGNPM